ncbi:unnamed protein product, partial [Effrenium voratum]
ALGTAHSDEVVAHLAGVVHLLASGGAPPEVAAHLAGGALLALPKGDGDVRPIAVGETLRRLVGKCLCEAVREDAKAHFCPLQVGVATPLGEACLEELCTGPLPARASQQASLGSSMGGLGLRSAARHNAAAYTASVVAARTQCCALDAAYRTSWPLTNEALTALNANLLPRDRVSLPDQNLGPAPPSLSQRSLSQALDQAMVAVPNAALDLHADALLFRTMVQMRLRLAVTAADGPCPLCDGVADSRAQAAGLHVEVEKPGLLPPRLDADGAPENGVPNPAGRRPADISVANWGIHGPALDLAVTCGLRPGQLPQAAAAEGAWVVGPATDYEARKRAHLNICAEQGLQFLPIVAEGSENGWGPTAPACQPLEPAIDVQPSYCYPMAGPPAFPSAAGHSLKSVI